MKVSCKICGQGIDIEDTQNTGVEPREVYGDLIVHIAQHSTILVAEVMRQLIPLAAALVFRSSDKAEQPKWLESIESLATHFAGDPLRG